MLWLRLLKLIQILIDPFFAFALIKGTAAGIEHKSVLKEINPDFIVDVGANRGQFALIARRRFPKATIHSFEPLKEPAALFRRIFQFDPNVYLHEYAIGPHEQEMTIHVSNDDDSSSLLPISHLQKKMFPGTSEKETRTIQSKPLGSVLCATDIQKPALLKLDVQGFELQALEGCLPLLPLFSHIYIECSFVELYIGQPLAHEVISYLREHDFILSGIYNLYYDKQGLAVQGDFLFKKKATN